MGDEGWRVDGEGGCWVVGVRNRPGGSRSQHKGGGEDPDRWVDGWRGHRPPPALRQAAHALNVPALHRGAPASPLQMFPVRCIDFLFYFYPLKCRKVRTLSQGGMLKINILKRANLPLYCAEGGVEIIARKTAEPVVIMTEAFYFLNKGKSKTGKYTETRED